MSTELKSNAKDVSLTRFWGGQRGTCVQVTMRRSGFEKARHNADLSRNFFDSLQLTRQQALELAKDLQAFGEGQEQSEFEQQKDNYEDV